jgi:hypothetical protein
MNNKHVVFTSVNRAYLNRALALARSVDIHDPDVHFVLLLVEPNLSVDFQSDEVFRNFLTDSAFDEILTLNQLDTSTIANFENYSVIEMCTAVKGIASQFLLNRGGAKIVTYLDPDLYFFTSLEVIRKEHENFDVLLTPHLNHNPTSNSVIHNDEIAGSMNHGIFNLGFVSFRSSNRGKLVASWWADRLAISSSADYRRGLFTDQKWWDLSLVYFPDIAVIKHDGWNMAPWNLSERKLISLNPPTLISGDPLIFFHFSKFPSKEFFEKTLNYSRPELLGEVISEYSVEFDQATQDVTNLVISIEKFLMEPSSISIKKSIVQKVRSWALKRLNYLLDKYPSIYSSLISNAIIQRNAKRLYRKFVAVETKNNLERYDLAAIKNTIGNQSLQTLISHKGGGGVDEVVKFRISELGRTGLTAGVIRPIDQGTFHFACRGKSFQLSGRQELKNVLALSSQIEIHHIYGLEGYLDVLANASIESIYLHDRYFISQTPFADSIQFGDLQHEVAGVNIPLNLDIEMEPDEWARRSHFLLKKARKLYSPSSFLANQFREAFSDLSIDLVKQESQFTLNQTIRATDSGALQIILISPTNFHKGADVLLKVAQYMEKVSPKVTFVVIGDLDLRVSLELKKMSNVDLVEQMSRDRLKIQLSELKNGIGWIPSITAESYSLALSDFLSSGLMVVSSQLGAVAERLSQLPGHFMYEANVKIDDLAGDFLKIATDPTDLDSFHVLKQTKV